MEVDVWVKNIYNWRNKENTKELLRDKPVYQVILFGSYAKQKATPKSDINLTKIELEFSKNKNAELFFDWL